jgi:hypothetical protein
MQVLAESPSAGAFRNKEKILSENHERWSSWTSIWQKTRVFAPCYTEPLQLADLNFSGFKNPYKKIREQEKLRLFINSIL